MNAQEHQFLRADRKELQRILSRIPEECVLERISFEARLKEVEEELKRFPQMKRQPVRSTLTFRGAPVVGSRGVVADFATKAAGQFVNVLVTCAASLHQALSPTGPIPDRDKYQMLVTGTAVGSFGFVLEEYMPAAELDLDLNPPLLEALEKTGRLLEAAISPSDEELIEAIDDTDPGVVEKLHDFCETLQKYSASCAFSVGERIFKQTSDAEVRRCVERLSRDAIQEMEAGFDGAFIGYLPQRRIFEFRTRQDEIFWGKVDSTFEDPQSIENSLNQPRHIIVRARRVGQAKPRYWLKSVAPV
ncbi:MAG: hypothetical protein HQL56_19785 [Magnetococcales bacterium]|nr:hypothetical protein [Magnetococcales bacterium]